MKYLSFLEATVALKLNKASDHHQITKASTTSQWHEDKTAQQ